MSPGRLLRVVLAALLVLALCLLTAGSLARAAVTLVSFEATPESGRVNLAWETATELGTSGFYVVSSDAENGSYSRISPFIAASGGGLSGATYTFIDDGLTDGRTYYYKLEMVEVDNSSEFSSVISAVPGAATPTATRSATPAPSPTATKTPSPTGATQQPTSAPTDSAYPGPEATATDSAYPGPLPTQPNPAYPAPATSLATNQPEQAVGTPQPTLEQSLVTAAQAPANPGGPTATWIPQPTIAVLLPVAPGLPTVAAGDSDLAGQPQGQDGFPWTRVGPLAFIAVIWIMLGGWFYLSLRQME